MVIFKDTNSIEIENFSFTFVQELSPQRDGNGEIKQFIPQDSTGKYIGREFNNNGDGPFCKFSIGFEWAGRPGVYALFTDDKLLYIGECQDLRRRFNAGYGHISFRNRLSDGQSTNCKINTMILKQYLDGKKVRLYFLETEDYKRIEIKLINTLSPRFNGPV